MSFRLFVYYCALGGAWAGFVGWLLGRAIAPSVPAGNTDLFPVVLRTSVIGLFLGFAIAFGLSFLDAAFNLTLRRMGSIILRVVPAVVVGLFGGLCGGFVGGAFFKWTQWNSVFLISWIIVGFLVGLSICFFQFSVSLATQKDFAGSLKKFIKCVAGGTVGGLLGGVIALVLRTIVEELAARNIVFKGADVDTLWHPTAYGFVAIGACIGLLVGLAQILLKEAWVKVEAGFRPGREMLLQKEKTSIGRAEGADIALFGDMEVEKAHANIVLDAGRYYLEDLQTPAGSFVNETKVAGRAPLKTGDQIRVGRSVLRFNERAKRKD